MTNVRKLEFERRLNQATLKMPFSGQLTVSLPLTEGVEEYPVNAGQELAVARDLSLIRLRVALANPAWAGLPMERLSAMVRLPNGGELEAAFALQKDGPDPDQRGIWLRQIHFAPSAGYSLLARFFVGSLLVRVAAIILS